MFEGRHPGERKNKKGGKEDTLEKGGSESGGEGQVADFKLTS